MTIIKKQSWILTILLMASLLVTVVACGGDDKNVEPNNTSQNTTNTNDAPSSQTDEGAEADENAVSSNESTGAIASAKIAINQDGMYAISADQLSNAGISVSDLAGASLQLSRQGDVVPYHVVNNQLVFYGEAGSNRHSNATIYMVTSNSSGSTMQTSSAAEISEPRLASIPQTLVLEQNWEYEQRAAESSENVWFWYKVLYSDNPQTDHNDAIIEIPVDLPAVSNGSAKIDLNLFGLTSIDDVDMDHDFTISVNDTEAGSVEFDGSVYHTSSNEVDGALFKEGKNIIVLDNSKEGNTFLDQFYLDNVTLTYPAAPQANNDSLAIENVQGVVQASGFSGQPTVYNVSDPMNPTVVDGVQSSANAAEVGVENGTKLMLVGPDGYQNPISVSAAAQTNLKDTQQADLLIVTTAELAPGLDPLVKAREAQGLSVVVATTDEVYDTFGGGEASAESIHTFVKYAHENWEAPQPQYLFLVGEATTDPSKNFENRPVDPIAQPENLVPSPFVKVTFSGETVSDARLGDVDGDLRPDLAVGRWPVDSLKLVEQLVERTLAYESGSTSQNALFTSDPSDLNQFTGFTKNLISQTGFPEDNNVFYEDADEDNLVSIWNEGAWMVSYVGHGSLNYWGEDQLLTGEKVSSLSGTSDVPPIVMQWSCLTGHFAHAEAESLSERMLKKEDGPVLLIGATSLTFSSHQLPFAIGMMEALKDPQYNRMGDVLQHAKDQIPEASTQGIQEIIDTFGLIGDPSAVINRPEYIIQ